MLQNCEMYLPSLSSSIQYQTTKRTGVMADICSCRRDMGRGEVLITKWLLPLIDSNSSIVQHHLCKARFAAFYSQQQRCWSLLVRSLPKTLTWVIQVVLIRRPCPDLLPTSTWPCSLPWVKNTQEDYALDFAWRCLPQRPITMSVPDSRGGDGGYRGTLRAHGRGASAWRNNSSLSLKRKEKKGQGESPRIASLTLCPFLSMNGELEMNSLLCL